MTTNPGINASAAQPVESALPGIDNPPQATVKTPPETDIVSKSASANISLTKYTSPKRKVALQQQLQSTYCFSETDVKNIISFAEAFGKNLDEIKIKPTFHTKIRSLMAKILRFMGKETKANQILQQEGAHLLQEFKEEVIKKPEVTGQLLTNPNLDYESIQKGLYWVLSPKLMALAGGEISNILDLLKNNGRARTLFKEEVLSVTEEQLQKCLSTSLKEKVDIAKKFSPGNSVFGDINRGYAISFTFRDGKTIAINPDHENGDNGFEALNRQLQGRDRTNIEQFCRGFCSQGVFAAHHPFVPDVIHFEGNVHPNINVAFLDGEKVSVTVKVEGEGSPNYLLDCKTFPLPIPTETKCEFSFYYNMEDGSGTNVQVQKFEQHFDMDGIIFPE